MRIDTRIFLTDPSLFEFAAYTRAAMVVATHGSRDGFAIEVEEHEPTQPGAGEDGGDGELDGDLGDGDLDGDLADGVLEAGLYVDRYRILDVLGTGGIGVVYAAFDEVLGRNVALKLLRPSARNPHSLERRRARLIREAKALARLSHPNVVPIYEVGMFEDRVFLAMEYVEGATMRRWLRSGTRSVAEILDKYIQAGRGLAAAHERNIVHRDFKPDNVLVGEDERVRVLDFGLATPVPEATPTGRYATIAHLHSQQTSLTDAASLITKHGKIMGTPAYMAPEQGRGEIIDARADQYSYCVSVWEALFGERPHGPPTATARIRLTRRLAEHGHGGKDVPQSVQRALERGLSLDPDERFANMNELLAALAPKPLLWRRWMLAGLGPLGITAAVVAGVYGLDGGEVCPREDEALAGIWDGEVREQIGARLDSGSASSSVSGAHARASWTTIARKLDDWTTRWLDARVDACADTKLRGEQSTVLFDLRMACLDRQLHALATVTESLANDAQLESALTAVFELPDPARCERAALVGGARLSEEPEFDERVEDERTQLARAQGLLELAKFDAALDGVDAVLSSTSARKLDAAGSGLDAGLDAVLAEARLLRGHILAATDSLDAAHEDLRRALFLAQTHGYDALTVEACAALVDVRRSQGALDSASDWAGLGRATLERLGGDALLEAKLRLAGARLADAKGDAPMAVVELRRVVELREQLHGDEHVEVARALVEWARLDTQLREHDEAARHFDRALAILTSELGITHPEVGHALVHAAALDRARGLEREALAKLLDAHAIFELAFGPEHPRVIETLQAAAALEQALASPATSDPPLPATP